jgi:hypothetical protein
VEPNVLVILTVEITTIQQDVTVISNVLFPARELYVAVILNAEILLPVVIF